METHADNSPKTKEKSENRENQMSFNDKFNKLSNNLLANNIALNASLFI